MGYYGSWQHRRDQDKRAVIAQARAKLAELDDYLAEARVQRSVPPRIIYKTNPNALVSRRAIVVR
jgi:hypothetical protein